MKRSTFFHGITLLLGVQLAWTESSIASRAAYSVAIDFDPIAASCAVSAGDKPVLVQALFSPGEVVPGDPPMRRWLFACPLPSNLNPENPFSIIIERDDGPAVVKSVAGDTYYPGEAALDSEEKARQVLAKEREVLSSFAVQVKAQERELMRLRGDADVIGQHGSIADAERGIEEKERELVALKEDIRNVDDSIKQIRQEAPPANASVIEIEMTKQLSELAQAARSVESTERDRQSANQGSVDESLRVIEETRFDDPEKIRADLIKMRKRRQELEESLQGDTQSALDYE